MFLENHEFSGMLGMKMITHAFYICLFLDHFCWGMYSVHAHLQRIKCQKKKKVYLISEDTVDKIVQYRVIKL